MQTLFFTLIAFIAIILLMSIGFIIKKQSLKAAAVVYLPLVLPKLVIVINLATRFNQN